MHLILHWAWLVVIVALIALQLATLILHWP